MSTIALAQPQPNPAMRVQVIDARLTPAKPGGDSQLSMLLRNPTSQTLTLSGVSSPLASQTLMQRYTTDADGFKTLTLLPGILLAPEADAVITPGSLEIKLLSVTSALDSTMEAPLVLHFSDGFRRTIRVKIQESSFHD